MILPVIIFVLLCQVLGQPIIGGQLSDIENHPWVVAIHKDNRHYCGGSIISAAIILTAAHCITNYPLDSFTVRAGSTTTNSGGSTHRVVAIKRHENYTIIYYPALVNDLALIKVSPPMELSKKLAKIQMADKWDVVATDTSVSVAGWGSWEREGQPVEKITSSFLRIIDSGECARSYNDNTGTWMRSKNQICAFGDGSDVCRGDSGGPLVTDNNTQVGIASWGSCADPRYPAGVYTDVARYRDWIDKNAEFMRFTKYSEESRV